MGGQVWVNKEDVYMSRLFCGVFTPGSLDTLYFWLMGLEWNQTRNFKTVWMVDAPCSCQYKYSSYKIPAVIMPTQIKIYAQAIAAIIGVPTDYFNSVNINMYEDQDGAVGWHSDDEPLFQACSQMSTIASLSLGASRKFECRVNRTGALYGRTLQHGDVLTMEGMFQRDCSHRVPRATELCGPRINLTWRRVLAHEATCALAAQ